MPQLVYSISPVIKEAVPTHTRIYLSNQTLPPEATSNELSVTTNSTLPVLLTSEFASIEIDPPEQTPSMLSTV